LLGQRLLELMGTGLEEGVSWIFVVEVKRPLCGARRIDKTKSSNEGDNKVLVWPTIDVYALSFPGLNCLSGGLSFLYCS